MEPDNSVLSHTSTTTYALVNGGIEYVIHSHGTSSFTVTLSGVVTPLSAEWLDPETGETYKESGSYGNGAHSFTPPSGTLLSLKKSIQNS